jgi:hypothetical protein
MLIKGIVMIEEALKKKKPSADSLKSPVIGKIKITVSHIPSSEIMETTILFEDWGDKIYYCWTFTDKSGVQMGKCSPISKSIAGKKAFDYAINHSKLSIDNYKVDGEKIFRIKEIQKL